MLELTLTEMGVVTQEFGQLLVGLGNTLLITGIGALGAVAIGLVGGGVRLAGWPVARQLVAVYVELIRNTPLLVQIFILFFGLPELGIKLSPFVAASLALLIWGGAYNVENFRAGFEAVPADVVTGARALGMSAFQAFRVATIPLGVRTAIPAVTTTLITLFKSSSFMVAIGYAELTSIADALIAETFQVFEILTVVGAMYLVLAWLFSFAARAAERRLAVPGMVRS